MRGGRRWRRHLAAGVSSCLLLTMTLIAGGTIRRRSFEKSCHVLLQHELTLAVRLEGLDEEGALDMLREEDLM